MTTISKIDYCNQAIATLSASILRKQSIESTAREALAQAQAQSASADEIAERALALKSARNRVREDQQLARFMNSDELATLCYSHRIDFDALTSERNANSRECKKRLAIVLEALSVKNADALANAEARYFSALAANRLSDSHTLAQAQSAMKHQTNTQARYMRSFLLFINAASASDTQVISVKRDSAMMRKILALFA